MNFGLGEYLSRNGELVHIFLRDETKQILKGVVKSDFSVKDWQMDTGNSLTDETLDLVEFIRSEDNYAKSYSSLSIKGFDSKSSDKSEQDKESANKKILDKQSRTIENSSDRSKKLQNVGSIRATSDIPKPRRRRKSLKE